MARPDEDKLTPEVPALPQVPPVVVLLPPGPAATGPVVTGQPPAQLEVMGPPPPPSPTVAVPPEVFLPPRALLPVQVQVGLPLEAPLTSELTGERPVPLVTPAPEEPSIAQPEVVVRLPAPPPVPEPVREPQQSTVDVSHLTQAINQALAAINGLAERINALEQKPPPVVELPDLQPAIDRLERRIDGIQPTIDSAVATAQAAIDNERRTARILEGISANPNLVPVPPSAQQLSDSIAAWFSVSGNRESLRGPRGLQGTPGLKGDRGDPGPSLPLDQVNGAIARYLEANPPAAGRDGRPGRDGTDGVDGRTPTPDEIRGVVAQVFAGLPGFLSEPAEYIWQVILQGIRARFEALFEAVTAEE